MKTQKGFTLIELMTVIAIIGILAAIAIPNFLSYRNKARLSEADSLFDYAKKNIVSFYDHTGKLPANNQEAGLPDPENIKGKYVESLKVDHGAVFVKLNKNAVIEDQSSVLKFFPAITKVDSTGTLYWIKESDDILPWMRVFHDIHSKPDNGNPPTEEK